MNEHTPTHTDAEILASVDRVRGDLFDQLARPPRRRGLRLVTATVAVAALFGGGIAVGAAAYASTGSTASREPEPTVGRAAFLVNCYALGEKSPLVSQPFTTGTPAANRQLASTRSDPANVCLTEINQYAPDAQVGLETGRLHKAGHDCGTINVPGSPAYYYRWKTVRGLPQDTADHNPPATPFPSTCPTVTLPAATFRNTSWVSCTASPEQVDVYQVLHPTDAAATCRQYGKTPWSAQPTAVVLPLNSTTTWITQW